MYYVLRATGNFFATAPVIQLLRRAPRFFCRLGRPAASGKVLKMKRITSAVSALFVAVLLCVGAFAASADIEIDIRIVGLGEDMYTGTVSVAEGSTVAQALSQITDEVEITGLDSYITEINGLAAGTFGGWDGWNYRVNGESPSVGIADYVLTEASELLLYYGNFDMQIPQVAFENGVLTFTSEDTTYDDQGKPSVSVNPITGAAVTWDGESYVTDDNGSVTIDAELLTSGDHIITIEKTDDSVEPVDGKYLYSVLPLEEGYTVNIPSAGDDSSDALSSEPSGEDSSAAASSDDAALSTDSSQPELPETGDGLLAFAVAALLIVASLAVMRSRVK